jgi:hypothetical protein
MSGVPMMWRRTALVTALLATWPVLAQQLAPAATTCAPGSGRFEDRPQASLLVPGNCNLPDTRPVAVTREAAAVHRVRVELDRDGVPADGQTPVRFVVRVFDREDRPIKTPVTITVEHSGGRVQLLGARTDELGPRRGDLDRLVPGVQLRTNDGTAEFMLLAPSDPQDVTVRVTAGAATVSGKVSFVPELRDMIATGFFEGILSRSDQGDNTRHDAAFERDLRKFSYTSKDGKTTTAAQSMFFLKGVVKGEYLLTMAYDSDKAVRSRLFRDIRPEEFYPVYGDASIKGFDARSAQKFFVRIDKGRSFLLFGDYVTGSLFEGQALGTYRRSLTGLRHQYESRSAIVSSFAARDTLRQQVDEMPARGVSGPYIVSNLAGIRNSEKVEIVTRDRNQPSVILSVTPMTRFEDYTFEPFGGQIVFKAPVPTVDENFNPNTIRVTYEVDGGGAEFTVGGVDGRVNVGGGVSVGGSYATDRNPLDPYSLRSGNAEWRPGERTRITAEVARSERELFNAGNAGRAEIRHAGEKFEARVLYGQTDRDFVNPAATMQSGRREGTARSAYALTERTRVYGEALTTEDRATAARRDAGQVGVQQKLNETFTVDVGVRTTRDKGGPVNAGAAGISNVPIGQSYQPFVVNAPALNPAPQLANTTTARARLTANTGPKSRAWVEGESDFEDASRGAAGAEYQLQERTRLYGRYEALRSNSGGYGLNPDGRARVFTAGVDTQYMKDGQLFSELRTRDAFGGQEASAATGIRNLWTWSDGVRFLTGAERVQALAGDRREATALSGGVELAYDPRWRGALRVEYRQDNLTEAWLSTMAYTAKIDRDWSFIVRDYLNATDARVDTLGDRLQNRFQVGFAWRPVEHNAVSGLGRYENRIERDETPGAAFERRAHIVSVHGAFHPSRPWWVNTRLAAKTVDETIAGTPDRYRAYLAGGRVIYDINERWDLGLLAGALWSPQGRSVQWANGLEVGYLVMANLWVSAGWNWTGFRDRDLTGADYTQRGGYLRLRWKIDEDLFGGSNPKVNRTLGE